ncbi:serine/threonine-protein kinase pim-3-like isoform X2 [Silurus meridionalis]|uniref:serine/threonine-protein kinase pim-3-like isoform X2 n=1 Tax=Silurus meridionalis TaxID=175797 RepID=UPI001EEB3AEA|nr:serine/threonine-protein kinase pim-3-like isoform X2 [Silurus meridionalis]
MDYTWRKCPVSSLNLSGPSGPFTTKGWRCTNLERKRWDVLAKRVEIKSKQDHMKRETGYVKRNKIQSGLNPFAKGRFFARYTVGKMLGKGAFGTVYAGVRKMDGKKVAIKRTLKEFSEHVTFPWDSQSLPLEVVLMKIVCKPPRCPFVIELLEWFETDMAFIIIMEQPESCVTLLKYCSDLPIIMPEVQAKSIMRQLVKALHHCHTRGVFHRDIKLDNIILNTRTMQLKLIDFGFGYIRQNTTYTEYGDTPVTFPSEWITEDEKRLVSATVRELGLLLLGIFLGGAIIVFEEDLFGFEKHMSKACYSLISWCFKGDPKKQPTLKQILTHEWFKG